MLTYTERVKKSIMREVTQHRFDSETASKAQQVNWVQYGYARGPANSEKRRKQCVSLLGHNHAAFRCCKSYTEDKDTWRAWFMQPKQDTNIWQAVLRRAQAEQRSPIGNLTSAQVQYLRTVCRPPHGWENADDESWMLDPDLVQVAKNEQARRMRSSPNFQRAQRSRIVAYWKGRRAQAAVDSFDMCPIDVVDGRCRLYVNIDGEPVYEQGGLYITTNISGRHFLDYDPSIEKHGLVVKDRNGGLVHNLDSEPLIIWDYELLSRGRNTYYAVYKKTVQNKGQGIRQATAQEEKSETPFSPLRLLRLFWQRYGDEGAFTVYTTPYRDPAKRFDSMMEALMPEASAFERLYWRDLLKKEAGKRLACMRKKGW